MAIPRPPVRYQGKITDWKDERGFGFIAPHGGGPPVFLHVTAFMAGSRRPVEGDIVTYLLVHDGRGQPQAELADYPRPRGALAGAAGRPRVRAAPPATGTAILGVLVFFGLLLLAILTRRVPAWVLLVYACMSVATYSAYAKDKSAAQNGYWRTSEETLIMLGLACGWPGALLAQRILRHKSSKPSFQAVYWVSVGFNCLALAALAWIGWRNIGAPSPWYPS